MTQVEFTYGHYQQMVRRKQAAIAKAKLIHRLTIFRTAALTEYQLQRISELEEDLRQFLISLASKA